MFYKFLKPFLKPFRIVVRLEQFLCFRAELCARDAARTAGQLLQRKINALMRLDVRTHPDPVGAVQRVHLLQVFRDLLQLDDDRRRRNKIIHRTVILFPKFRTLFHDTER